MMGYIAHEDHFRKWDLDDMDIGDEHWVLVSQCSCGDPAYWEVYPAWREGESLPEVPLRLADEAEAELARLRGRVTR